MNTDLPRVGPYFVASRLGAGGMGIVYRAHHRDGGPDVALKVISSSVKDPLEARRRFQREIKIQIQCRHPNLVQVLDAGLEGDLMYLAMELVEGPSLSEVLKSHGGFPRAEALTFALFLSRGIEYLHGMGVWHRDLKPQNILLARDGIPRIADFGLAVRDDVTHITSTGMILGTLKYLTPEMAAGERVDAAADVYVLGLILHEIMAGSSPFDEMPVGQVMARIGNREIPKLRDRGVVVDEEVETLIGRMVSRDPSARPGASLVVKVLEGLTSRAGQADLAPLVGATGPVLPVDQPPAEEVAALSMRGNEDDEWLAAASRGDPKAFERLVQKHEKMAWNVAYTYFLDGPLAEEIVQNAFLKVYLSMGQYRPAGRFTGYLRRIVVNLCLDWKRKTHPDAAGSFLERIPHPGSSPSMKAGRRSEREAVRASIENLAPKQRMAIMLRYFCDLGYQEIADTLGLRVKAVEKLLAKGRRNLQSLLQNRVG